MRGYTFHGHVFMMMWYTFNGHVILMRVFIAEEEKPVRLSLHLIVKRQLPPEAEHWGHEKM